MKKIDAHPFSTVDFNKEYMNIKSIFWFTFPLFMLTGCSATGQKFNGLEAVSSQNADIYLYRLGKFVGSANPYEILVDGEKKALLQNSGFLKLELTPGQHKLIAQPSIVSGLTPTSSTASTILIFESGKRYFLKLEINSHLGSNNIGRFTYYVVPTTLELISEQEAVNNMSELNYSE